MGEMAEIKLRCDKKYVFFHYYPEISYRTPQEYGDCQMELVGNPGTRFNLIQF